MFWTLLGQYAILETPVYMEEDINARMVSSENEESRYSTYQQGAQHFRDGEYAEALKIFVDLRGTASRSQSWLARIFGKYPYSWVTEASTYMIARCQLILSQNDWHGYGDPARSINGVVLQRAESSYVRYLDEYPKGLYVNSAQNIHRKISYLSGDQSQLDLELKQAMLGQFPPATGFTIGSVVDVRIISEFINYFRGNLDFVQDSPILLAYAWLRTPTPDSTDMIALEARESDFAPYPGLFRFVQALGLYKLNRFGELLEKTPEVPCEMKNLWLSTQLLRARSFAKTGDTTAALAALQKMHAISPEDQIEVEIASMRINHGDGLWLFSNRSPIIDLGHLRMFAMAGLQDSELVAGLARSDIKGAKRQIIADELARRYILTGRFVEFTRLFDSIPVTIFMPVESLVTKLAANPHDMQALVNVGEFLYDKYITPFCLFRGYPGDTWVVNPAFEMKLRCGPCAKFHERVADYAPPIWFFISAVEIAQKSGRRSELEAKALHYIVRAGRSGYSWKDRCTWNYQRYNQIPIASSQSAFRRLHRLYKDSPWAKATPYWYK
jgi:hypothetical protein